MGKNRMGKSKCYFELLGSWKEIFKFPQIIRINCSIILFRWDSTKKQINRSLDLLEWAPNNYQSKLPLISLRSLRQHLTLGMKNLVRKIVRHFAGWSKNSTSVRSTKSLSPSKEANYSLWDFKLFILCKSLDWCYLQKYYIV